MLFLFVRIFHFAVMFISEKYALLYGTWFDGSMFFYYSLSPLDNSESIIFAYKVLHTVSLIKFINFH